MTAVLSEIASSNKILTWFGSVQLYHSSDKNFQSGLLLVYLKDDFNSTGLALDL